MFNKSNTAQIKAKQEVLVERWAKRINAVDQSKNGNMNFEEKGALATVLENTKFAFRTSQLNESTDAGATDGIQRFTLDLITAVN